MNVNVKQAAEFLRENDNYVLLCHVNPDGDTLGSGYALCGALHLIGKRAKVICADTPSSRFDFLHAAVKPEFLVLDEGKPEIPVTVDVADVDLVGEARLKYKKIALCVDHHVSNKRYAERTLLDSDAAACAEVAWELVKELSGGGTGGAGFAIPSAIKAAIYTGVSTDTGCFRHSNTTAKSHRITAELMTDNGAGEILSEKQVADINYLMFDMKTRERIRLEEQAYAGMEYFFDGRCALITLTSDMLKGVDPEDSSNISAVPKQIEGVKIGVVIKEKEESKTLPEWKISIRTNMEIDAQAICSELGGGGHTCAAGCKLRGSLETIKASLLEKIEKQM